MANLGCQQLALLHFNVMSSLLELRVLLSQLLVQQALGLVAVHHYLIALSFQFLVHVVKLELVLLELVDLLLQAVFLGVQVDNHLCGFIALLVVDAGDVLVERIFIGLQLLDLVVLQLDLAGEEVGLSFGVLVVVLQLSLLNTQLLDLFLQSGQ